MKDEMSFAESIKNLSGVNASLSQERHLHKMHRSNVTGTFPTLYGRTESSEDSFIENSLNQAQILLPLEEHNASLKNVSLLQKAAYAGLLIAGHIVNATTVPGMTYFVDGKVKDGAVLFWKFALMAIILVPCIIAEKKVLAWERQSVLNKKSALPLATASISCVLWQVFALKAIIGRGTGFVSLLGSIPVVFVVAHYFFNKQGISIKEVIAIVIGIVGAFMGSICISGSHSDSFLSITESTLSSVMLSIYLIRSEKAIRRVPPFLLAFVTSIVGMLLGYIYFLVAKEPLNTIFAAKASWVIGFILIVPLLGIAQIVLTGVMNMFFGRIAIANGFCLQPLVRAGFWGSLNWSLWIVGGVLCGLSVTFTQERSEY